MSFKNARQQPRLAFLPTPLPSSNKAHHQLSHRKTLCKVSSPTPDSRSVARPSVPNPPSPPRQKRHRPRTHSHRINEHAKMGDLSAMHTAIRSATEEGFRLNVINYTTIANAHALHGNPAEVFSVFTRMRQRSICPTSATLRVAIKACNIWRDRNASKNALVATLQWYAADGADEPDGRTWNMALACLAKMNAVDDMLAVMKWMCNGTTSDKASTQTVPMPNICSYNTCLHTIGTQRGFEAAVQFFLGMLYNGPKYRALPDVVSYNTLLELALPKYPFRSSTTDASKVDHNPHNEPSVFVDTVLRTMERRGIRTNITTETLIMRLLCKKGATRPEAPYVWKRYNSTMEAAAQGQYHADKMYFDSVLTAFANAADMNGMYTVFTEMTSRNIVPDMNTIRAILVGASRIGDISLALRILDLLHERNIKVGDHAYTAAIATCARSSPKDPASADKILELSLQFGAVWSPAMINAAISTYGDQVFRAIELWKKLRASPEQESRDVLGDPSVYNALMRVCGSGARPDIALRIFYAAKSSSHLFGNSTHSRQVFNAFMRGVREQNVASLIDGNVLKRQYLQILKTECGVREKSNSPIERIRIKL